MSEQAPAVERTDGAGQPCWESHLDRSLAARLARRTTIIPTALGDRIWRRIEYFTARGSMLAQSLGDRLAPAERSVDDTPIVHARWQPSRRPPEPDSPSASSRRGGGSLPPITVVKVTTTVIEAAYRLGIESTSRAPASADAPMQLPIVTSTSTLGRITESRQKEEASSPDEPMASVGRPRPASMPREDGAVTLRMPSGRGRAMPSPAMAHAASGSTTERPLSTRVMPSRPSPKRPDNAADIMPDVRGERPASISAAPGEDDVLPAEMKSGPAAKETTQRRRLSPKRQDNAADIMPDVRGERPASISAPPGKDDVLPVEMKSGPAVNEATHRSASGSQFDAAPCLPKSAELPLVTPQSITTQSGAPAQPQPSLADDGPKMASVVTTSPIGAVRTAEAPRSKVVSPAAAGDHTGDGVVTTRLSPAWTEAVNPHASAQAPPGSSAFSPANGPPQKVLPHAGVGQVRSPGSADLLEALQPRTQAAGDRSDGPFDVPAPVPDTSHVPTLSTSVDTQRVDEPSPYALRALIDIDRLARQVERRISKRLAVDAERGGGWS